MKKKITSASIILLNLLGVLCLIYYMIPYVTHDVTVANPDAMLPMEAWDRAGWALTMGFFPLLIANVLAFLFIKGVKTKLVRALFFVPGMICFIIVAGYWGGEIFSVTMYPEKCSGGAFSRWNQTGSRQEEMLEAIDIDISSGTVVEYSDSHEGFYGDGLLFEVIAFDDDFVVQQLAEQEGWKALPLSESLKALLYGVSSGNRSTGPFLTNEDSIPVFPEIPNGYYCFLDRHSESTDKYDDTDVLDRYSFNLTIAIYDTDTDTLYYAEFDT